MQKSGKTYNSSEREVKTVKLISLGLSGPIDDIRAKLQQDCNLFQREGYQIVVDQLQAGKYTFLNCSILEGEISFRNYERIKNLLKLYAAQILADLVVSREEQNVLRRMIRFGYDYFSPEEQDQVLLKAMDILGAENPEVTDYHLPIRRSRVFSKILDYLDFHNELVLDGFIRFRLKDYGQVLNKAVEKAVDDYMLDIEYQEFVRVLRYFVNMQEPRTGEVHVVVDRSGTISIFDSAGDVLSESDGERFVANSSDDSNGQDLLMSALITIVPCAIIFHFSDRVKNTELVNAVKDVFADRVIVCDGCNICNAESSQLAMLVKSSLSN
jgi:putative sporulation protein YtxC